LTEESVVVSAGLMGALAHKLEDVGSSAVGTVRNPSLLRYCTSALLR
jgi:hypothetical protein